MSKLRVVTASSVSWLARPGRLRIELRKLTTAACVISTPFGMPVEPEV